MEKDKLISELTALFYATPICHNLMCNQECYAIMGAICFDEEDCINNKIRKLIDKIKKESK